MMVNEIQSEWYFFILPITTLPTILLLAIFYKFVVPAWFKSLEEE